MALGGGDRRDSIACRPRARFGLRLSSRISNKSAAEAGLQLLIGGARHAHHGPKIREWSRAEGEAPWADQVPEMRLACNKEPRKKIVLEAARGVIIC